VWPSRRLAGFAIPFVDQDLLITSFIKDIKDITTVIIPPQNNFLGDGMTSLVETLSHSGVRLFWICQTEKE